MTIEELIEEFFDGMMDDMKEKYEFADIDDCNVYWNMEIYIEDKKFELLEKIKNL